MNKTAYEYIVGIAMKKRASTDNVKSRIRNSVLSTVGIPLGVGGVGLLGVIGLSKWQKNRRIKDIETELAENYKAIEDLKSTGADNMAIKEYIDRNVLLKTELGRLNSSII